MSMTVDLRLIQKSVFSTFSRLGYGIQLDDSAENVYKTVSESGLPMDGFYVHDPNVKELSANDILGVAVNGSLKSEAVNSLKQKLKPTGIIVSNPQRDYHLRQFFLSFIET